MAVPKLLQRLPDAPPSALWISAILFYLLALALKVYPPDDVLFTIGITLVNILFFGGGVMCLVCLSCFHRSR